MSAVAAARVEGEEGVRRVSAAHVVATWGVEETSSLARKGAGRRDEKRYPSLPLSCVRWGSRRATRTTLSDDGGHPSVVCRIGIDVFLLFDGCVLVPRDGSNGAWGNALHADHRGSAAANSSVRPATAVLYAPPTCVDVSQSPTKAKKKYIKMYWANGNRCE